MSTLQERHKDHVRECTLHGSRSLTLQEFAKEENVPFEEWYSNFYPLIPENRVELRALLERLWDVAKANK